MTTEQQKAYADRYWKDNKERISAARREKYATDSEYRQKQMDASNKHRQENGPRLSAMRRLQYKHDPAVRLRTMVQKRRYKAKLRAGHVPAPKELFMTIAGLSVRLYRISEATRRVGCNHLCIPRWHDKGWVPEPVIVNGRRLYTQRQVELIAEFYAVNRYDKDKRTEVRKYIFENWNWQLSE